MIDTYDSYYFNESFRTVNFVSEIKRSAKWNHHVQQHTNQNEPELDST
jgi:hypothetical protein